MAFGDRGRNAYCKLPNQIGHDRRLGPEALTMLAYRATFIGDYALNRHRLSKEFRFGDARFDRGIGQMQAAGYTKRWRANDGSSRHARTKEVLCFSREGSLNGYAFVRRYEIEDHWFAPAAVLVFLRSHPAGQFVFVREVAERFDWQEATASKSLRVLVNADLVMREQLRGPGGALNGFRYAAQVVAEQDGANQDGADRDDDGHANAGRDGNSRDRANQDDVCQDRAKEEHYRRSPATHTSPSTLSSPPTPHVLGAAENRCSRAGAAGDGPGGGSEEYGARSWLDQFAEKGGDILGAWRAALTDDGFYEDAQATLHPAEIAAELRAATHGRVFDKLLTPVGLTGFFRLVGAVACLADSDVETAKRLTIEVVEERFATATGSTAINSWSFLGLILYGRLDAKLASYWSELED